MELKYDEGEMLQNLLWVAISERQGVKPEVEWVQICIGTTSTDASMSRVTREDDGVTTDNVCRTSGHQWTRKWSRIIVVGPETQISVVRVVVIQTVGKQS